VLRNIGTWTNFCVFTCTVVGHAMTDAQQCRIFATLDCIHFSTTANTSGTVAGIWIGPGRTVFLVCSSERQKADEQSEIILQVS